MVVHSRVDLIYVGPMEVLVMYIAPLFADYPLSCWEVRGQQAQQHPSWLWRRTLHRATSSPRGFTPVADLLAG